jgi:hypothetical protein
MPRFFFDYRNEVGLDRDEDGLDFIDLQAAHREAIRAAADLWIEALRDFRYPNEIALEIRDVSGKVLLIVPLRSKPPLVVLPSS